MTESESKVRRIPRGVRISIEVGIVAVLAVAIGAAVFIEYSAQPSFCLNCHVMEPYYDSWQSSSHQDVKCIACHYAPGIKAEAMGKLQAANQVVKYVTGTYGLRPWAEIEDAACLRSGCHTERKLEGEVDFNGVLFDHANHLGELRRGKQLRCTSCHSQIVQGDHIAVTQTTCYLCHFKDDEAADGVEGCIGCHPSPAAQLSESGLVIDHQQYVRDLVSCTSCHDDVIHGDGAADRSTCLNCHAETERLREFDDTEMLHQTHISGRKVECTQCHTPIEHSLADFSPVVVELDCAACHTGAHDVQMRLYAGLGGHGIENTPSAMYTARVSCTGCHELLKEIPGHGDVRTAGESSCMACHGIRYANILPAWQTEIDRRVALVGPVVRRARNALGTASVRGRAAADSLIGLAEENVDFVRLGKGAHNISHSDQLLRAALDLVREAASVGSLGYSVPDVDLGPVVDENVCLSCHLGVESSTTSVFGVRFDHRPHTLRAGLECAQCHTSMDDHGGTTIVSQTQCADCHHQGFGGAETCVSCHSLGRGAPSDTYELPSGNFPHDVHGSLPGVSCRACHNEEGMSASETDCASCHTEHHFPEADCLACHRGGAVDYHEVMDHAACVTCHESAAGIDRWTRQVCLSCHAGMRRHNAPEPCQTCHRVPSMGAVRESVPTTVPPATDRFH
jgi:nitrate/TMAO reductase-like tetraheme cytochrome c subunit